MSSLSTTLRNIANIINPNSDYKNLLKEIEAGQINWELLVKVASHHVVLPTVYCSLKEKKLLKKIPTELNTFLAEITSINRNRNLAISNQINQLGQLFQKENIHHVFLKGAALLSSGIYKDIGERMIGDIDILIHSSDITRAFKLLENREYVAAKPNLSDTYGLNRHLPRLLPTHAMAAVELHQNLFTNRTEPILTEKDMLLSSTVKNGIEIPGIRHLFYHNILNLQINDHGYLYHYFNIRNAYDTLLLLNKAPELNITAVTNNKYFRNYLIIYAHYFEHHINIDAKLNDRFKLKFYEFKNKHSIFRKFYNGIIKNYLLTKLLLNRLYLLLTNKSYKKDIIEKGRRLLSF